MAVLSIQEDLGDEAGEHHLGTEAGDAGLRMLTFSEEQWRQEADDHGKAMGLCVGSSEKKNKWAV